MKNFLNSIAENWKLVSEAATEIEIDFSIIEQVAQGTAVKPNVYDDFNLDDVEDF